MKPPAPCVTIGSIAHVFLVRRYQHLAFEDHLQAGRDIAGPCREPTGGIRSQIAEASQPHDVGVAQRREHLLATRLDDRPLLLHVSIPFLPLAVDQARFSAASVASNSSRNPNDTSCRLPSTKNPGVARTPLLRPLSMSRRTRARYACSVISCA